MMNAVISGRSAVALLLDGDRLASIHADAIDQPVPRQPADLPFLFGDGYDLQFLENVTSQDVAHHLKLARDSDEALHLALIVLDSELSEEVRQEAAAALDELLIDVHVSQYLRSVLYAQPLPDSADLRGAFDCCKRGSAKLVQDLFIALHQLQPQIRSVRLAWDAIPKTTFGSKKTRAQCYAVAIREGIFRDLVIKIANREALNTFLTNSLQNPVIKSLPELQKVLQRWLVYLRDKPTTLPLTPEQAIEAGPETKQTKAPDLVKSLLPKREMAKAPLASKAEKKRKIA
jgi:hypothetical protein